MPQKGRSTSNPQEAQMDDETWIAVETLTNLIYLIEDSEEDKDRLRVYVAMAKETVQRLRRTLEAAHKDSRPK